METVRLEMVACSGQRTEEPQPISGKHLAGDGRTGLC